MLTVGCQSVTVKHQTATMAMKEATNNMSFLSAVSIVGCITYGGVSKNVSRHLLKWQRTVPHRNGVVERKHGRHVR